MRALCLVIVPLLAMVALPVSPASAAGDDAVARPLAGCSADAPRLTPWAIEFGAAEPADPPASLRYPATDGQAVAMKRPIPVEYSDGYKTRAKIHRISSFATLPLFIANYVVGQDLYNNQGDESKRGLHVGLVTGTAVLFGANTVTGAWNLWEGRKDPNHRTRRTTHAVLMMVADVGFLATAMLAPEGEDHEHGATAPTIGNNSANTHRAVALTSMGIATVSYLIMLLGGD